MAIFRLLARKNSYFLGKRPKKQGNLEFSPNAQALGFFPVYKLYDVEGGFLGVTLDRYFNALRTVLRTYHAQLGMTKYLGVTFFVTQMGGVWPDCRPKFVTYSQESFFLSPAIW
jgi:hypothetical protein